jgi:brefeldin A-inhibited guanine nucleotide-exchange protein
MNPIDHLAISHSLMNIISKIGTTPSVAPQQRSNEATSPAQSPTGKAHNTSVPPSFSTSAFSISGMMDTSVLGLSESQLKRQGLECLVAVLRSLVVWGTAAGKPVVDSAFVENASRSQTGEDIRHDIVTPDPSFDRLPSWGSAETLKKTPDVADDPTKFESAKQKKTTLLEGIRKFNFKPKRVRVICGDDKCHLMHFL